MDAIRNNLGPQQLRQLDEEKACADALAAALRNALERLGSSAAAAEVEATRAHVSHS